MTIEPCIICGAERSVLKGHRCAECMSPLCENCECDCDKVTFIEVHYPPLDEVFDREN